MPNMNALDNKTTKEKEWLYFSNIFVLKFMALSSNWIANFINRMFQPVSTQIIPETKPEQEKC